MSKLKHVVASLLLISMCLVIVWETADMKMLNTGDHILQADENGIDIENYKQLQLNIIRLNATIKRLNDRIIRSDISMLYSLADDNTEMAEENYYDQRKYEITQRDPWDSFAANFPCFWGELFIDSYLQKEEDGGKFGCGLSFIQKPCIVYSFGSKNNFKFEHGVNDLTHNKCDIYTFDPFNYPSDDVLQELSKSNMHFYKWGISDLDDTQSNMYRLDTIMTLLNHTFIDILKMDVEGYEYPAFYSLYKRDKWPSIGQILIEIHITPQRNRWKLWKQSFGMDDKQLSGKHMVETLIELLETYDFRIFHQEINKLHLDDNDKFYCEYSLIQKHWRPHIKRYNTSHRT